jgi:hypothetical protein
LILLFSLDLSLRETLRHLLRLGEDAYTEPSDSGATGYPAHFAENAFNAAQSLYCGSGKPQDYLRDSFGRLG